LIFSFKIFFSDVPNKTTDACHDVDIGDAAPIKQHLYWLNPLKREVMRNEIQYMLDNDIIEPSIVTGGLLLFWYLSLIIHFA
jgi:hypothetical protein